MNSAVSKPDPAEDQRWMRAALLQARYALGQTAPNPAVGCVLVNNGVLVGRGRTAPGGRPHAETTAIQDAGDLAQNATAYVTLEPCSHHGQTPPCVDALITAGISRVVIAAGDPDPRVAGQGVAKLQEAGVEVTEGVLASESEAILQGYLKTRIKGRPFVTVKIASSLDGRIALANGQSKWITGPRTRHFVHLLRSQHDAMLTAMGTVRADNPSLTCRLEGYSGRQPLRVISASQNNLSPDAVLATSSDQSDVLVYASKSADQNVNDLETRIIDANEKGYPDPRLMLDDLAQGGITSVMVEAGGQFIASLMAAGVIDRLVWTRSAGLIGGDGLASMASLGLEDLSDGRIFRRVETRMIGDDVIEIFNA